MSARPVAVVTGGGGGIGAAIAMELGRRGAVVVTLDPLVTLDGTQTLPEPVETTAGRIVAAGGEARASNASVTDRDAVAGLFASLVAEFGRLDAVVNVAGITRPTAVGSGTEDDWWRVLDVHLGGYCNVAAAALDAMAPAGRGVLLGVTSGSGWRSADAGAYSAAKRAVASLTWQLGQCAPPGVTVAAISPIAATRMVAAALGRATSSAAASGGSDSGRARSGGLSLSSMPAPEELAPLVAHLLLDAPEWSRGRVVFAGGSEVAVVAPPRPIEVIRTDGVASLGGLLDAVIPGAFVAAEAAQATTGGSNSRFAGLFAEAPDPGGPPSAGSSSTLVIAERREVGEALAAALVEAGSTATVLAVPSGDGDGAFEPIAALLTTQIAGPHPPDSVVVAAGAFVTPRAASADWRQVAADHDGLVGRIIGDAAWMRAAVDAARHSGRELRLLLLVDAATPGGRSRAQAAAQVSRAVARSSDGKVAAVTVSVEADWQSAGESVAALSARLAWGSEAEALSGAELAVAEGRVLLRCHPRPVGSISFGGPELPAWFDTAMSEIVGQT